MTQPRRNDVDIREVYALLDKLRDELRERDQQNWSRIDAVISDVRLSNDRVIQDHEKSIMALKYEIWGEGEKKGLKDRVGSVEGRTNWFAGIQLAITIAASSVAAYLGMRMKP